MCLSDLAGSASVADPPPRPCPTLKRLLALAGARPEQRVCVAGPQGLAVLLSLIRLGYGEACYVSGPTSSCGDEPCDVLLVTGPQTRDAFVATLATALPRLKVGGVLAAHEGGLQDDLLIQQVLAGVGRQVGWRVHDMAGSCLVAMEVLRAERRGFLRAA